MTIPFGKYKGKSIEYVYNNDLSYFKWLVDVARKDPLVTEIAEFYLHLKENENKLVYNTIDKIEEYISNGERVFSVNIHNVGQEYRIKDISLEEIVGNQYTLWISRKSYTLHKENFDVLQTILEKYWIQTGRCTKDRGLY